MISFERYLLIAAFVSGLVFLITKLTMASEAFKKQSPQAQAKARKSLRQTWVLLPLLLAGAYGLMLAPPQVLRYVPMVLYGGLWLLVTWLFRRSYQLGLRRNLNALTVAAHLPEAKRQKLLRPVAVASLLLGCALAMFLVAVPVLRIDFAQWAPWVGLMAGAHTVYLSNLERKHGSDEPPQDRTADPQQGNRLAEQKHLLPSLSTAGMTSGQELSPGEQPNQLPLSPRRIGVLLLVAGVVGGYLFFNRDNLRDYRDYFADGRLPAHLPFGELSESWSEATVQSRFAGFPVTCYANQYPTPTMGDRVCSVEVGSNNNVPTFLMSFFFLSGRMTHATYLVPWWEHARGQSSIENAYGPPVARQMVPRQGARLLGWQLPDGAAIFYNRDRPLNPLWWNAMFWTSASACEKTRCIRTESETGAQR